MGKEIDIKTLMDSDHVALDSEGKIISVSKNPESAKAEAIIKGTYSPFVIQVRYLEKNRTVLNK